MDKNLEVICIDDSDNEDFKESPQTSRTKVNDNILVISSDEDGNEGEVVDCNKIVGKNVPTNKIRANNVWLETQSQANKLKKTNFLGGTTTENLSQPVNVDYQKSTDKVNVLPQKGSNYQLQAQGSELKSASTILQDNLLAGKLNETKWNLIAYSIQNSSKNHEEILSKKVECTPGCNLGSNNKQLVERQNCQSSEVLLKRNVEKDFGSSSYVQNYTVPARTSQPVPALTGQTVPVITSQPDPIKKMSVITPPVQNAVAINVQSSSLQSAVRAPLVTNVQMPRNPPVINQNSIQIPISIPQNMIRNSMPIDGKSNFLLVSPFSNRMLLNPPALQQFPNQFAPNQSAFPVFVGRNIQNALGPQTSLRPQTTMQNNQSQIIVMQAVSKSTTQLSSAVSRNQKLQDFAQLVLVNPSQQRENINSLPSSSVNKTTLFNSNGSEVQFCVKGDSNLELRPLPPNSRDQTVKTNPLINVSNGSQCSNVNRETLLKVTSFPTVDPFLKITVQSDSINANLSGVSQVAPRNQNEAPTENCDQQRDPKHISEPPWLKKAATQTESFQQSRQSCISSSDHTKIKVCQSSQTEFSVKPPISVLQLLSCVSQSSQDPNGSTLFQILKPSDPKRQYNTVSEPNPNPIESISIQNKPSNLELESNLSKNVFHTPSTTYEEHSMVSQSTQCNNGININALDSKSLQPSDPHIFQISGGTEFDWKPSEILTGKNNKCGNQLQENLNGSCFDEVSISVKTEDDVIHLDDSSDDELKEVVPAKDTFQQNVAQDLPLTTGLLEGTKTENSEGTSEKMLEKGKDIIRIQIDATLNKTYDHSDLKINVNNGSFQNFSESSSNLSSIDIKEEINGTNFTINYSSDERGVPDEKQYCTINNDSGIVTADCKTIDVKDIELLKVEQEVKIENSDETTVVNSAEFKMENDEKCMYAVEELSFAKIEAKSESGDSYEHVSKIEPKSECEDSSEEKSEIESSDVDVGMVNDSSNDTDYEIEEQNQYDCNDLSEAESDLIDYNEVPISLVSNSDNQTFNEVKNEIITPKDEKPYVCPHCGFCVAIERNLEIHIKAFHSGKKAPSLDPPKVKEQSKNVKNSTSKFSAEKIKFKCTSCDFEADKSSIVSRHLQTLHGVYACIKCTFRGNSLDELKTHEGIHKTVKCVLCESKIAISEYQSHLSTQHPVTFRFKCKSCEFKANAEWQLRNHYCGENGSDNSDDISTGLRCNLKRKCTTMDQVSSKRPKLRSTDRCPFICNICGFRASNELSLSSHKSIHFMCKGVFKCNYCSFTSESKLTYTQHNYESHPEKFPYACHVCNFRATRKSRLKQHMKRHDKNVSSQEKPVCQLMLCKHCNFETDNADSMMQHCQEQHGNEYMNRGTVQSYMLTNFSEKEKEDEAATFNSSSEKKKNTSKKTYPCKFCKFVGVSQSILNQHRYKIHVDKLPYSCKKCIFRASEWYGLERHEKCVHKLFRKHYKLYECKFCSFKTSEMSLLTKHKYKDHWSRYRFKCSLCSYRTPSKSDYNNHYKTLHRVNDKDKNASIITSPVPDPRIVVNSNSETEADLYFYYCYLCNKRFKFISDYEVHIILVHDKCKKCPCCSTFVTSADQLYTHKYHAHSSMFKFKCSSCSFCSLKDKDISIHETLFHKPIVCYYCDFSVTSINKMNDHILKFHPERNPLLCDKCGYQTTNEKFLNAHHSEMHPKIKCLHCEFLADSKQHLLSHISDNHSSEILACTKCSFCAEAPELMVKHSNTCHYDTCQDCRFLATSSERLGIHKFQKHPKKYASLCLFCSFQAGRVVNLIRHELNVHFKRTYRCTLCFFYSESVSGLSDHFLKFHSPPNTLLRNDEDPVSALNITAVRVSLSNENQSGSIKCQICDFYTTTPVELYKHYAEDHPSIYRWSCMLCTYRSKRLNLLFNHLRKVHGVTKFYRCKHCPFVVHKQSHLFKHRNREHPKKFSYKCDLCSYNSHKIINLQIHCRNKHKRKLSSICLRYWQDTLLCFKCDFWSKNKRKLIRHIHTSCFDDTSSNMSFDQGTTRPIFPSNVAKDTKQDLEQKILLQKVKDLENNESMIRITRNKNLDLKTILKCSLCKFCTPNRSELKFHGSTIHNTSSLYVCDWCESKTDYDLGSIIEHIEKEHKTDIKCPACSFMSLFKTTLKDHIMHNHSLSLLQ